MRYQISDAIHPILKPDQIFVVPHVGSLTCENMRKERLLNAMFEAWEGQTRFRPAFALKNTELLKQQDKLEIFFVGWRRTVAQRSRMSAVMHKRRWQIVFVQYGMQMNRSSHQHNMMSDSFEGQVQI